MGDSCGLSSAERERLVGIDLSSVRCLPEGFHLRESFGLESARLPVTTDKIPSACFENCHRLTYVNTAECLGLEAIYSNAFMGCFRLHSLEVPPACVTIDVSDSGIQTLDLSQTRVSVVNIRWCGLLRSFALPEGFLGQVSAAHNVALCLLRTPRLPDVGVGAKPGLRLQYTSSRGVCREEWNAWMDGGQVAGEVVGLSARVSVPLLPP
jgi:hypothetical protein